MEQVVIQDQLYSVTLSAASMTPQTFAALNTQYGEETS